MILARLFPNPRFHGWVIVTGGFLATALSSPGQSFLLGLYLERFEAGVGISRVQLAGLYAGATLGAALVLPLAGRLLDRIGARVFLAGTVASLGAVLMATSLVQQALHLGLAFFALRLLGQGAMGLGALTVTARWFDRYRGRALGTVSLGYAFGELAFPSVVLALIFSQGWRSSLLWLGGVYLCVFGPLVFLLLRERRPDEAVDGEAVRPPDATAPLPRAPPGRSLTVGQAVRRPVFWGLVMASGVAPLLLTAILFHQVAVFAGQGWTELLIAPAMVAFACGNIALTYLGGLALERVPSRFGLTGSGLCALAALGSTLLPLPPGAAVLVLGALLGGSAGLASAANGQVWPDYFGVESLGAIRGLITSFRNGAAAAGPPLLAVVSGAEVGPRGLWVLGGIAAFGALLPVLLPGPARPDVFRASRIESG